MYKSKRLCQNLKIGLFFGVFGGFDRASKLRQAQRSRLCCRDNGLHSSALESSRHCRNKQHPLAPERPHRLASVESSGSEKFLQLLARKGTEGLSVLLVVPSLGGSVVSAHGWHPQRARMRPPRRGAPQRLPYHHEFASPLAP